MDAPGLTPERIAVNQSRFREANEKIEAAADNMSLVGPVPFICECADSACMEIIRLTLEEYEEIRQHPRRFFNAPGHETLSLQAGASVIVARHGDHVLLDKVGVAGEVAAAGYENPVE